jgi:hypothetical protein
MTSRASVHKVKHITLTSGIDTSLLTIILGMAAGMNASTVGL